ncbi:hypothetical protein L914_00669, partial [Phytophthora nicotianae]
REGDGKNECNAFIGLELAMRASKLNDISENWSEKLFLGQADFSPAMGRSRFQKPEGK